MLKPERIPDQPRRRGHIDGESRPAALSLDLLEQLALELLRFDLSLKLLLDLLKLHQLEPAAKLPLRTAIAQRLDELEHRLVNGPGGRLQIVHGVNMRLHLSRDHRRADLRLVPRVADERRAVEILEISPRSWRLAKGREDRMGVHHSVHERLAPNSDFFVDLRRAVLGLIKDLGQRPQQTIKAPVAGK